MNNSFIYRKKDIEKIDKKLRLFGISSKYNTQYFLNIRLLLSILVFLLLFLVLDNGYIIGPIGSIIFYYIFTYLMIDKPLKVRELKLEKEGFYFIEIMTLSIEEGRNIESAIKVASENVDSEIALEFREMLNQVKLGKSFNEALEDMREKIPSDAINNIISNIMQASLFGSGILETMYNQLDYLRDKQIMEIKSEIAKIPTKISVFSVLIFIPLILLIILSPVLIDFLLQ